MVSMRNVVRTGWYTSDAWRVGQEPEAITEALKLGEQIMGLFIRAATVIEQASRNADGIIENSAARCQVIVDQLMRERVRLAPLLARLRAASKAVVS